MNCCYEGTATAYWFLFICFRRQYVWHNPAPIPSTYEGEISSLKAWLGTRLEWLDANIPNIGSCYDYPPNSKGTIIVSIYPNPLRGNGTVVIQSKNDQLLTIRVYDIRGRTLQSKLLPLHTRVNTFSLSSADWAMGIYTVSLQSSNGDKEIRKLLR